MKKILITGSSGFIGYHLTKRLLNEGYAITGIDNHNDYYDVKLKESRLELLQKQSNHYKFHIVDIANKEILEKIFKEGSFDVVIHLAAQAGVRYSIENPQAYTQSNLVGFVNIVEACRHHQIKHLLFASSSSVYGGNMKVPFSTTDSVDHPVSLYAATKKANELIAHSYAHLYGIPMTGLRFFTVYGPYGRPDMAYYSFTKDILEETPIKVFNQGELERDFTYIDDIVEGIARLITFVPKKTDKQAPYQIFNLGNNNPVPLMTFIKTLEEAIGKEAIKECVGMQKGDVLRTWADVDSLIEAIDFRPNTPLNEGIKHFVTWYKDYYKEGD